MKPFSTACPISPLRLNPDLPPKLEEIISKALEKDADMRYQNASDLRTDLKRLKRDTDSGRSASRMQVAEPGGYMPPATQPTAARRATEMPPPPPRHRRRAEPCGRAVPAPSTLLEWPAARSALPAERSQRGHPGHTRGRTLGRGYSLAPHHRPMATSQVPDSRRRGFAGCRVGSGLVAHAPPHVQTWRQRKAIRLWRSFTSPIFRKIPRSTGSTAA